MSWDKERRQWQKMLMGVRYRVSCSALGLHPGDWTEERSYQAANNWWESKLLGVLPAVKDTKLQAKELLVGETIETQEQADFAVRFLQEKIAFDLSFILPEGFHQLWLGNSRYSQLENGVKEVADAAAPDPARTVSTSIDQYLAIQVGRQKPKTFKELKDFMEIVRGWYGSLEVSCLSANERHLSRPHRPSSAPNPPFTSI